MLPGLKVVWGWWRLTGHQGLVAKQLLCGKAEIKGCREAATLLRRKWGCQGREKKAVPLPHLLLPFCLCLVERKIHLYKLSVLHDCSCLKDGDWYKAREQKSRAGEAGKWWGDEENGGTHIFSNMPFSVRHTAFYSARSGEAHELTYCCNYNSNFIKKKKKGWQKYKPGC